MQKRFAFFSAMLLLLCSGCIKTNDVPEYDFSTGYVQIGCRVNTGKEVQETAYSRIGFPWWFDNNENTVTYGIDITPAIYDNGTLNGLGIALASLRNKTNGILFSPICSIQKETRGGSLSLVNVTLRYSPGLQIGLWNHSGQSFLFDYHNGATVQLALLNQAVQTCFQLGIVNSCHGASDVQVGLVNSGHSIPKQANLKKNGFQFGLFNYSENGILQLGLLNYNGNSAFCKWFPLVNFAGSPSENGR